MPISDNIASDQSIPVDLKAIILDYDGTLIDSEPVWKQVFFDLFEEKHGVELTSEILWTNTGNGVDLSVANISKELGLEMSPEDVEKMANAVHEETRKRIIKKTPLRDGVMELFEWAREKNIALAICTASTHDLIDEYFGNLEIRDYFRYVFSTAVSDMDKRKPHPFPYLETMKELGVTPEQTLVIEDSPSGVQSARAAGVTTIAINNPFLQDRVNEAGPMVQVNTFAEVLDLLQGATA